LFLLHRIAALTPKLTDSKQTLSTDLLSWLSRGMNMLRPTILLSYRHVQLINSVTQVGINKVMFKWTRSLSNASTLLTAKFV